jgi:flagellar motor component MotA
MIALVAGIFAALIGLIIPDLRFLYNYAWFVGFGVAALLYVTLMGTAPRIGGATPLAQRIKVKVLDPALGSSAGAKARIMTTPECEV